MLLLPVIPKGPNSLLTWVLLESTLLCYGSFLHVESTNVHRYAVWVSGANLPNPSLDAACMRSTHVERCLWQILDHLVVGFLACHKASNVEICYMPAQTRRSRNGSLSAKIHHGGSPD